MKLIFLTIYVIIIVAVPFVECRELRPDSLSNILIEEILKPSPFPSLLSPSLASGQNSIPTMGSRPPSYASHQPSLTVTKMSPDLRPTTTLEVSDDASNVHPTTAPQPLFGAGELAFVQLVKLVPTQSTNPTNAPLSVDQLSQREEDDSENLSHSWISSSIALVAVGGTFLAFILLAACGAGYDYNDDHSTGTTCITLCPSTDEEITYETECDENISCSVIAAQSFEDVVKADYDENRVDVVIATENDENISYGVVSFEDVVEAEYYDNISRIFISDQSTSLSRSLAPVPEESSIDYGRDEMSEFSV